MCSLSETSREHGRGGSAVTELGERLGLIRVGVLPRAAVIMAERRRRDRAVPSRVRPQTTALTPGLVAAMLKVLGKAGRML